RELCRALVHLLIEPCVRLAQCAFHPVFVDRHLDGGVQLPLLERLDEVAERQHFAGPAQQLRIRVGAEENHRDVRAVAQALGGLDARQRSRQPHVHEHDVRGSLDDGFQSLLSARGQSAHLVAEGAEPVLHFHGDERFILHDEDLGPRRAPCRIEADGAHGPPESVGKEIATCVPSLRSTLAMPPSWAVRLRMSCHPKEELCCGSKPSGRPTPSSLTHRCKCPSEAMTDTSAVPERPSGKAYLNTLVSSSHRIMPQGTADSMGSSSASAATRTPTLRPIVR